MNNILSMLLDVEINWVFYTVISVMVILGFLAIFFISRRRNSIGTRALVFGAVTVAITVVLNFLKIDTGLYGGSITFFPSSSSCHIFIYVRSFLRYARGTLLRAS